MNSLIDSINMNPDWITFLQSKGASLTEDQQIEFLTTPNSSSNSLYPITDLTTFIISGEDGRTFLQGQLTCNINEIQDNQASLAAYCNAKGRVISTLLVCKKAENFILILPTALLNKVMNKLRMYILRSKVRIEDSSAQICLLGLSSPESLIAGIPLPVKTYEAKQTDHQIFIKLPGNHPRYLIINDFEQAKEFWLRTVDTQSLSPGNSTDWSYLDLSAGIPWFDESASEEYIPQMLNIDKLGGISFTKGCYTGQEIVARTHYLGKAKRELVLADCCKTTMINADTVIINSVTQEAIGKIVAFQCSSDACKLLLVIRTEDSNLNTLILNNSTQDKINIIPFQ